MAVVTKRRKRGEKGEGREKRRRRREGRKQGEGIGTKGRWGRIRIKARSCPP